MSNPHTSNINVLIQARMSSKRFPGKVLAPLAGRPIISWVIESVSKVVPPDQVIVTTSSQLSDDPLFAYVQNLGVTIFRGDLNNVFARFQECLQNFPCEWFFRISADSPLLNIDVMQSMLAIVNEPHIDLITNVQKRTFPHGHSVELVNSSVFTQIDNNILSDEEREHVTKFFYAHPNEYCIKNIENMDIIPDSMNYCVDTIGDLQRLEAYLRKKGSKG